MSASVPISPAQRHFRKSDEPSDPGRSEPVRRRPLPIRYPDGRPNAIARPIPSSPRMPCSRRQRDGRPPTSIRAEPERWFGLQDLDPCHRRSVPLAAMHLDLQLDSRPQERIEGPGRPEREAGHPGREDPGREAPGRPRAHPRGLRPLSTSDSEDWSVVDRPTPRIARSQPRTPATCWATGSATAPVPPKTSTWPTPALTVVRYDAVAAGSVDGSLSSRGPPASAMAAPPPSASGNVVPVARPTVVGAGK